MVWLAFWTALSVPPAAASERTGYSRGVVPEKIIKDRKEWGLDLEAGANFVTGNVDQSLVKADLSVFKISDPYVVYVSGRVNELTSRGTTIRDEWKGAVRVDRKLDENWKLFAFTTHSHNSFLLLDYRGSVGAGPWVDLKSESFAHAFSLALAPQYESYSDGIYRWFLRASFRYIVKYAIDEHATAGFETYVAPALVGVTSLRATAMPFIETDVWRKTVGLKVDVSLEYDSNPVPGVQSIDRELATSLTLHLGE